MTSDKLNYLLVLAEEQNLTRAAKRLFITQPTLTAYINHLEQELGVRLFDRKHNPVRPTRAGQIYMEKMKQLVMEEEQLKNELACLANPHNKLTIGIGQIHSEMWCPELVERLLEKYPDLNISIRENKEAVLMDYLKNDEIDLFFGHVTIDNINYHFEVLFDEQMLLLVPRTFLDCPDGALEGNSPDNPWLMDPRDLDHLTIISPSASQGLYLNFQTMLKQYRLHPVYQIGTSNMITAVNLVARGLGCLYSGPVLVTRLPPEQQKNIVYCTIPRLSTTRKYYCGYSEQNSNKNLILDTVEILKNWQPPGSSAHPLCGCKKTKNS